MKKLKPKLSEYINLGTDEEMEIWIYEKSWYKIVITWFFIIISLGFLRLVLYWKPNWLLWCTHKQTDLKSAEKILLKDKYFQYFIEDIERIPGQKENRTVSFVTEKNVIIQNYDDETLTMFTNKLWRYKYNEEKNIFERITGLEEYVSMEFYHSFRGWSKEDQEKRVKLIGENSIKLKLTPIIVLIFKEVLSPFYIFQIFSCISWMFDEYIEYAVALIVISVFSILWSLYFIRKNEKELIKKTIHEEKVNVLRKSGNCEEIPSTELIPGDIVEIKSMTTMTCDAVLLNGNVIVNESMLTGESVPVTKTGLNHSKEQTKLSIKSDARHILFSGTQVIQTRFYSNEKIKALVIRTGFNTTKGELIRSILFPKPVEFRFNRDTYKYIAGLSIISIAGMIYTFVLKLQRRTPAGEIVKRILAVITTVIPPALPGALTACLVYAQDRLKKKDIYCISPSSINICGTLNTFVFDKTGTLTEDGLDLKYVLPSSKSDNGLMSFGKLIKKVDEMDGENKRVLEAMASCHSLTHIHGDLAGDPLDLKMFEFTKWELVEYGSDETQNYDKISPSLVRPSKSGKENDPFEIGLVKQFPFSSSLQRMSVIVKYLNETNFTLFTKGSPEKILELSDPKTIPGEYQNALSVYTKQGYRVIAVAAKKLDLSLVKIEKAERQDLECDLEFLGFIIMENRLKPETTGVISKLKDANIRTIMCTGDNILTALSVARDCKIIDVNESVVIVEAKSGQEPTFKYAEDKQHKIFHYAIDGQSFEIIRKENYDLLKKIVLNGTIFARMSPDQKQQLIEILQELGLFVGMCGDGANDCGALKAAHSGISLSDTEASVASPFTSKNPNIKCVLTVISESRASLVTSFGLVKYVVLYSLIWFFTILVIQTVNGNITSYQYLYIDISSTIIFFLFSRTEACEELCRKPPPSKLMAWRPIVSILLHSVIIVGYQLFLFFYIQWQPWFEPFEYEEGYYTCYHNTVIFFLSLSQQISISIIFSKGWPYRKSILSNYLFTGGLFIWITLSVCFVLIYNETIYEVFEMVFIDVKFRFVLLGIFVTNFFVEFILENFIMDNDIFMNEDEYEPRKRAKENFLNPIYMNKIEYDENELNQTAQNRNSTRLKNRNNKIGDSSPVFYNKDDEMTQL